MSARLRWPFYLDQDRRPCSGATHSSLGTSSQLYPEARPLGLVDLTVLGITGINCLIWLQLKDTSSPISSNRLRATFLPKAHPPVFPQEPGPIEPMWTYGLSLNEQKSSKSTPSIQMVSAKSFQPSVGEP